MRLYDFPFPGSRGSRARWMLEETGVPFEVTALNPQAGELKTATHMERHPHGKVPALETDGLSLIESGAICLHLADLYPEAGLAPAVGTADRGHYYQWVLYAAATLDEPLIERLFNAVILPATQRDPAKVERADKVWASAGPFLNAALEGQTWLVGDRFSAADVAIGYDVHLAGRMGMLDAFPNLGAYRARLMARPAFQRVYGT